MDCLTAQRLVSEKLDREPVDSELLESAKSHCRSCPECGAYVRTLIAVNSASLPAPSEELHGRIMRAVAEEMASAALASAAAKAPSGTPAPHESDAGDNSSAWQRFNRAFNDPRNRNAVISWTVAAAMIFIVAGIGTIAGLRQIAGSQEPMVASTEYSTPSAVAPTEDVATRGYGAEKDSPAASLDVAVAVPDFITVGSMVYRVTQLAQAPDPDQLKIIGSTTNSLDPDGPVVNREVYSLGDPSRVYVKNASGEVLGFDRVTRSFNNQQYALLSGPLTNFGQWPTLPAGVNQPTSPDGAPEYSRVGVDSLGVAVYGRGGSMTTGVLVAPATPSSDPAAGSPNWTWWEPIQ